MEYDGGDKHHYTDTRRERWDERWDDFHSRHGFAIGPMIFFGGFVLAMLFFKGLPG